MLRCVIVVCVGLCASFAVGEAPITVLKRATVFAHAHTDPDDPANTTGLNHGPILARLPDGRLMAAWWTAPTEGAASQRIVGAFSSDQGTTWTQPTVMQDYPGEADYDPALLVAGPETLLFFSSGTPLTIHVRRSGDSGRTWSEPQNLGHPHFTTRSNGIVTATGDWILPMHRRGTRGASVLKSTDGGATWRRFGDVTNPAGQGGEPTIAETRGGTIVMMLRTKDGLLWRSESADHGETWSAPVKTGLTATSSASHLLRMRDGTLVLALNPEPTPLRFPLVLRVSRDDGKTWSEAVVLADRPTKTSGWSICYPTLIELPDGTLGAIWTEIKNSPGEIYGDIRFAQLRLNKAYRP